MRLRRWEHLKRLQYTVERVKCILAAILLLFEHCLRTRLVWTAYEFKNMERTLANASFVLAARTEISRDEMLSKIHSEKEHFDVVLKGNDDVEVLANRSILSARSPVFHKMFNGKFRESSGKEVPINYASSVLRAVVEYILKDHCHIFEQECSGIHDERAFSFFKEQFRTVVTLVSAAMFFALPKLGEIAQQYCKQELEKTPELSYIVLELCNEQGLSVPHDLEYSAISHVRSNTNNMLTSAAVQHLSRPTLEAILRDDKISVQEYKLLEMLELWVNSAEDLVEDRNAIGRKLVECICLERIRPTDLEQRVERSRLVEPQKLLQAYRTQALSAQNNHGIEFERPRHMRPAWKSSSSAHCSVDGVDILSYPDMTSGVHEWMIDIERYQKKMWLGVALTTNELDLDNFLGNQKVGWVYGSNGASIHAAVIEHNLPKFVEGSRVKLSLNLLPGEQGNGTLSVSVDGKDPFQLFTGLRGYLGEQGVGFVPAVCLKKPGKVHLVHIEQTMP